jgi:hypothetical protein
MEIQPTDLQKKIYQKVQKSTTELLSQDVADIGDIIQTNPNADFLLVGRGAYIKWLLPDENFQTCVDYVELLNGISGEINGIKVLTDAYWNCPTIVDSDTVATITGDQVMLFNVRTDWSLQMRR